MTEAMSRVLALLEYIEQAEKLKKKPPFAVPKDYYVAYQNELTTLPELAFNLQEGGDDVWVRIPRLREISPPEPDELLKPWLTLSRGTEKSPELKTVREHVRADGSRERLSIEDNPEVAEAFEWYSTCLWRPWAEVERERRKTIKQYNTLFSLQQAIAAEGADTPLELVWGIGIATWKRDGSNAALMYPLLVQACEVTLNETTFDLEVRPRDVEPRIELDAYAEMGLQGVTQLEAQWRSTLENGTDRLNPFEASTYEATLKAAVGHLDPNGAFERRQPNADVPPAEEKLKISNSWVLFGRKRSGDIFLEDVLRLKKCVEAARELPPVVRSIVEPGDSSVRVRPEVPFRGLSSSSAAANSSELYFPMPYNDEQVAIVKKLALNDGVVVQGPPGTGKTHTIANVICHYLANGKRVLVTSKGETALTELQNKLPQEIRALSVALLSDEHDGKKQFEHSIQTIASTVAALDPARTAKKIDALEGRLNQLHAQVSVVDADIAGLAEKHIQTQQFHGREVTSEQLAKEVLEGAAYHEWFDDEPAGDRAQGIPIAPDQVASLRDSRLKVGRDLEYVGCPLPAQDEFPAGEELLSLHAELIKAKQIDSSVDRGELLSLVDSSYQIFEKAEALCSWLDRRRSLQNKNREGQDLGEAFSARLADLQSSDPLLVSLETCCSSLKSLEERRRSLLANAIRVPVDAELNVDYLEAITRLSSGKSAFALPFGRADARKAVSETTVLGSSPSSKEAWNLVLDVIAWRKEARDCLARWAALSEEFNLPLGPATPETEVKASVGVVEQIKSAVALRFEFNDQLHPRLAEVFGKQVADRLWNEGEELLELISRSLASRLERNRLANAMRRVQEMLKRLENRRGPIVEKLRTFLKETLGNEQVIAADLQYAWSILLEELGRVLALRPSLQTIAIVSNAIARAGAPKWAKRIVSTPVTGDSDPVVPQSWLEAWRWRQAVNFLDEIEGHSRIKALFERRRTLTADLTRTYKDLIAEKTWLEVHKNSPELVRQALQAYLNAIQAMGSGTGVRAIRYRKNARAAMAKAYQAVPCWVLPHWRVSESIPAELGLFDLVVIDEASQSDIWALPAILRGKKLLVVGDHKQVSPSAVGAAEERIRDLSNRFLQRQPFGSEMTPDKSIYDLARVVFAGNSVMLREHFRCVPAIIEYSNREFYEGEIRALRLPTAFERLDPPLIDVFVKGGFRKGDMNHAEAKAIVDEISSILADDQFKGKTLGVVTLLGHEQAAHIHELVTRSISPVDVVSRKLSIGPPPIFQGKERDIMLVSMVIGQGDRGVANRADMQQRFNVALSRARDRMYLFRSVPDSSLREDSLNRRVLEHFKKPFRQDARRVTALREKCESDFEREMFDELVRRNFRVVPQVASGGYRIDFVIEGNEGRRLAVECDGDKFHGPGHWHDDMARQRVLERAGWTFWRCFASSFVRRRKEVLEDLVATLNHHGIEPLGSESVDSTEWVLFKEVDPLNTAAAVEAAMETA